MAEICGCAELAKSLDIEAWRLRRELMLLELSGQATFKRVGLGRVVEPHQREAVLAWLRRRGLIAEPVAA